MARRGWYEGLANALKKEDNAVLQLATIEPSTNTPRVRSVRHRGFVTAHTLPELPFIILMTDVRTPKVTQLAAQPRVELVYWISSTQEQFRVSGRASVVPAPGYPNPYPPLPVEGKVHEALAREGFDWEAKRVEEFNRMNGRLKASWCRPVPGTQLKDGEEKQWPRTVSKVGEAEGDEEKRDLEMALGNFALLVVEPFEVDYVELGVQPQRRRSFQRDWKDDCGVEFKETPLVV